jgi:hypothetical protein
MSFSECHFHESYCCISRLFAECHYGERHFADRIYSECHFAERCHAECHFVKWHYVNILLLIVVILNVLSEWNSALYKM